MDIKNLLVAFLKDHSAYEREDLYGKKLGDYEFVSGGSVGGHMHLLCYEYLLNIISKDTLVKACLELQEYEHYLYSDDCNKDLWNTINGIHKLMNKKREEIVNRLMENSK